MPFKSDKQRRYMFANEPEIAKRFSRNYNMGGVASMFRKKLADGDLSPDQIAEIESYAATGLDASTISSLVGVSEDQVNNVLMDGSTSEMMPVEGEEFVETAEVTEEDPMMNLFAQNIPENNSQPITTLFNTAENPVNANMTGEPVGIMAARGGRIPQLVRTNPDGSRPGYAGPNESNDGQGVGAESSSSGGGDGGDAREQYGAVGQYSSPAPASTTSSFTDADDNREKYGATTQYSNFADYEDEKFGYDDTDPDRNLRSRQIKELTIMDKYDDKINPDFRDKWNEIKNAYSLGSKVMNATTGVLGAIGAISAIAGAISKEKEFNEQLAKDIDTLKEMGVANFNPTVDTPIQTLEQLQVDKLNSRINKDDDGGSDGVQPYISPVTLEVDQDFAEGESLGFNMKSALDKIRANQARRSGSISTGNIQDNEFMMANKGGLAGLFKVKN